MGREILENKTLFFNLAVNVLFPLCNARNFNMGSYLYVLLAETDSSGLSKN